MYICVKLKIMLQVKEPVRIDVRLNSKEDKIKVLT